MTPFPASLNLNSIVSAFNLVSDYVHCTYHQADMHAYLYLVWVGCR